jgi:hypothetical protein
MPDTSTGIYYEERGTGSDVLLWIHGFGSHEAAKSKA